MCVKVLTLLCPTQVLSRLGTTTSLQTQDSPNHHALQYMLMHRRGERGKETCALMMNEMTIRKYVAYTTVKFH